MHLPLLLGALAALFSVVLQAAVLVFVIGTLSAMVGVTLLVTVVFRVANPGRRPQQTVRHVAS